MSSLSERFWAKVNTDTDGCWEWTAGRNPAGYGRINVNGSARLASRVSWELTFGEIPKGMIVCHRCDNPPCVRPDHLFIGTHLDNARDMVSKNRSPRLIGEKSGRAKLTMEQVDHARALRRDGMTVREIAEHLGIHSAHASRILRGERWPVGTEPVFRSTRRIDWSLVVDLRLQGLTQPEIARRLGCNSGTISRILQAEGIR